MAPLPLTRRLRHFTKHEVVGALAVTGQEPPQPVLSNSPNQIFRSAPEVLAVPEPDLLLYFPIIPPPGPVLSGNFGL